jgi:hypothetical protein
MGRPQNVANGAVPPFAAIEAACESRRDWKREPHFAYNKTIPYRFVLVNDAAVR